MLLYPNIFLIFLEYIDIVSVNDLDPLIFGAVFH